MLSNYRVLVVDDQPLVRRAVSAMASFLGGIVHQATDGLEAIQRISVQPYDLVISDLNMPHNGSQLISWLIRTQPRTAVVIASSFTEKEAIFSDALVNQAAAIKKPFGSAAFRQAISSSLVQAKWRQRLIEDLDRRMDTECVLLPCGELWLVNDAWNSFSHENGGSNCVGMNYLEACRYASPDAHADSAEQVITTALAGDFPDPIIYPCHAPNFEAYYRLRAKPLKLGQTDLVHVRHEKIGVSA